MDGGEGGEGEQPRVLHLFENLLSTAEREINSKFKNRPHDNKTAGFAGNHDNC